MFPQKISAYILSLCCLFVLGGDVWGRNAIKVVGLFKNAAIVQWNGKRVMLKQGKPSPSGLLLVASDTKSATIQVAGETKQYYLESNIGGQYVRPEYGEVVIARDGNRRYYTAGSINGQPVGFLVDTGATTIALNRNQATKLGIDFRLVGREGQAMTASGVARSFSVKLERVKVGDIELKNIDAAVVDGDFPATILLGMSFLERVEMTEANGVLRLRKRY
jgi:aspartyl protease family protein